MNVLAWNVQGVGNDRTFRALHANVREVNPNILFLSETLGTVAQMEFLRVRLGFTGKLVVEKVGRSGGLCLFWLEDIDVTLLSFSRGHIDVLVSISGVTPWRFTGIYGQPDASLRHDFWTLLRRIAYNNSYPWVCGGDWNEILVQNDKDGGPPRPQFLMNNFRTALDDCFLSDMGFVGPKYTWVNKHRDSSFVQERLDRFVCNSAWMNYFPDSHISHLTFRGSDHRPIALATNRRLADSKLLFRSRFHYENAWASEFECENIITS
ncbi:uncharacterized protein LOC133814706 [Humulus lupulus]|uniref:uncharacterized protein LOC133814706 n=1 Tax=Humulus lupulus TaxID=3486 RepID=UPI002B4074E5|nr:uncharacterized protein LOC133814706 [Humulus lupulus]